MQYLSKRNLGKRCLLAVPGIVLYFLLYTVLERGSVTLIWMHKADLIYLIIVFLIISNSILLTFLDLYSHTGKNKTHPLKGLIQGLQAIIFFVGLSPRHFIDMVSSIVSKIREKVASRKKALEPEVIEPDEGVCAIGSGGNYALAAARALYQETDFDAETIARKALKIASEICVFTNDNIRCEVVGNGAVNATLPPAF